MNTRLSNCSLAPRVSRRPNRAARRAGISLFEVLISILVAAIGVFGVLVLIPFAVRNAQLGIDRESAINAAKNFNADFQAIGYQTSEGWFDDVVDPQVTASGTGPSENQPAPMGPPPIGTDYDVNQIVKGWLYVIDPVGAATRAAAGLPYGQFPTVPTLPADFPQINVVNVNVPNAAVQTPVGLALARQLAMQPDDLKFDKPATELGPPRQIYYSIGTDPVAKRQYDGRYSTISFVIPNDDQRQQYRMYTVVGKAGDRNTERVFEIIDRAAAAGGIPDLMRLTKTDVAPVGTREFEQVGLGGGDLLLSEIPTPGQPELEKDQIRNNDWIMLISYYRLMGAGGVMHDDIQIDFHRVIHANRVSPPENSPPATPGDGVDRGALAERTFDVTVQGTDFDLYRDWGARVVGDRSQVPTYAILLPNVLAVYERTFKVEPDSTWQSN